MMVFFVWYERRSYFVCKTVKYTIGMVQRYDGVHLCFSLPPQRLTTTCRLSGRIPNFPILNFPTKNFQILNFHITRVFAAFGRWILVHIKQVEGLSHICEKPSTCINFQVRPSIRSIKLHFKLSDS